MHAVLAGIFTARSPASKSFSTDRLRALAFHRREQFRLPPRVSPWLGDIHLLRVSHIEVNERLAVLAKT